MMNNHSHAENVQGLKFPIVGKCIYCGSDGGPAGLRDEHIIPYSLDGDAILKEASCRQCEAVTSYLDGYLARKTYYDFRLHSGVQSRRQQPTKRRATVLTSAGKQSVEFDIKDHPHFLNLPVWGRPGLMYAEHPTHEFKEVDTVTFFNVTPTTGTAINAPADEDVRILNEFEINFETFSRGVAKIAYCAMVAAVGLENFRPLLTPAIILGRYAYPSHFVGCQPNV